MRRYGVVYRQQRRVSLAHLKVMSAISSCRTARLGGHVDQCDACGHLRISYNSCRNRHCPKCQWLAKEKWLEARRSELLPVPYFHVVFTLPHLLNPLVLSNDGLLYNLLFKAAWATIKQLCKDPKHLGAEVGMIGVLHTWGQRLNLHPHLHCIVPGGGLTDQGQWRGSRPDFFIHVKVLSTKFRGKFLALLKKAKKNGKLSFHGSALAMSQSDQFDKLINKLYQSDWVTYSKAPFGGPMQVVNYLSRYTHRVAITNQRLIKIEKDRVYFQWKDYQKGGIIKETSLPCLAFIQRFLLHVLPKGFQKIRYYGILAIRNRKTKLALCQELLDFQVKVLAPLNWQQRLKQLSGIDPDTCPCCGQGKMQLKQGLPPIRSPPTLPDYTSTIIRVRPKSAIP